MQTVEPKIVLFKLTALVLDVFKFYEKHADRLDRVT